MTTVPLLDIHDLTVEFATRRGTVRAVEQVELRLAKGETVGIVGKSGSGKSVTSYAVMRILDRAGRIAHGSVHFSGLDLCAASESAMRDLRGREISMIFQNPRAALNPIRKVGRQIEDVLLQHAQTAPAQVAEKAIEILDQVRIARPRERYHAYPFELSGGMCQRVVIALALACRPQLLIADEPTTGLDVTTQKTVMDLIVELTRERGMATILITHDLGLAAVYCDRIVVMEKGHVVESATARSVFTAPAHAYTRKLMRATPRPGASLRDLLPEEDAAAVPATPASERRRCAAPLGGLAPLGGSAPLLVVEKLVKEYPRKRAGQTFRQLFGRKPTARAGDVSRRGRGELRGQPRRKRRAGGQIRLRQIHDLHHGDAPYRQDRRGHRVRRGRTSARSRPGSSPGCRCASASRWCSRIRPTASIRASPRPAPSRIRCCGWAN